MAELRRIAQNWGFDLDEAKLAEYRDHLANRLVSYGRLELFLEPDLPVQFPRDQGYRPTTEENPLNAWYWKCSIKGEPAGKLAGKKIAIKDNVCVAGIPMMNGARIMEGFVPSMDATVVTRILQAGGEIVGKAACEHFSSSGGSHTSDTGPVLNPHDRTRSSGGSSSGSTALVVAGECDMAIGADQGGSIRIPSSWCGAFGLKPTYGLVPYTGIFPFELTLDHVGPIARSPADTALLLEVIAGSDNGLDPRQSPVVASQEYTRLLTKGARKLRIGVVQEGFNWPGVSEPDVDSIVREAANRLIKAGATVTDIHVPMHRDGIVICGAIVVEGATMMMVNGQGTNWSGHYLTQLQDFYGRSRRVRANDFSERLKLLLLSGQYLQDNYQGHYYAKAQNLRRVLRAAYDEAFNQVDLLLMPTTPIKATRIPPRGLSFQEDLAWTGQMALNTAPFNATGHPALNVPCGMSEGLPVGMMLIGRNWEDGTVLNAAHAFQEIGA